MSVASLLLFSNGLGVLSLTSVQSAQTPSNKLATALSCREALDESIMPSCQSTGVKLEPTTVSVCERCMNGKARGGRVTKEGSHNSNEIEALDESAMPFVSVHRGETRTDGDGVQAAVDEEEGWSRRSRGREEPQR
ncbi:hypothetical protein Syun_023113 [Stephania yunnanensis]|uniref:Secreted protein n=1 Tax=Stephania yunnanensis TaxID=152371 RepID=A0AAP0FGT3_9MAGN